LNTIISLHRKSSPFICIIFCCIIGKAQDTLIPLYCDSTYYVAILDSLKKTYSNCKNIPEDFELAFYTAVSHYPELTGVHIEMKLKPFNFCMAARPAKKMLAKPQKRVYRIYANNKKDFIGVLPSALKYNQKVGVIGHELAHVLDYTQKNLCRLTGTGISYMFVSYRRKLEAVTDLETIRHGLGWQLYDYNDFLLNHSNASDTYKKKKIKVYLNEKEIKELIIKNSR